MCRDTEIKLDATPAMIANALEGIRSLTDGLIHGAYVYSLPGLFTRFDNRTDLTPAQRREYSLEDFVTEHYDVTIGTLELINAVCDILSTSLINDTIKIEQNKEAGWASFHLPDFPKGDANNDQ